MADVEFQDFSMEVKAELNETTIAWLHETCNEIAAQAQRNCQMDDEGKQLKGSYSAVVDESNGEGKVGSPLEAVYWEEFGTGEYADTGKNGGKPGREGWWVYVKGGSGYNGPTGKYNSKQAAEAVAASMRADGYDAYATNGRRPNYTLEKAFDSVKEKAKQQLETLLKERLGK